MVVMLLLGSASAASAQTRPGYPAVFEGDGNSVSQSALTLNMTMTESYDEDLLAEAGAMPQPAQHASGAYTSLFPQVTWRKHGRDLSFTVFGASSLRYYPTFAQSTAVDYTAGAGASAKLTRSTTLNVNSSFGYAPTYLWALFAGTAMSSPIETAATASSYQTNTLRSYVYGATATLDQAIGRKASLSFTGDLHRTTFVGQAPGFVDTGTAGVGGYFNYAANRNVTIRVGYQNRTSNYSAVLRTTEHDVQVGALFTKNLSPTRRLTAGFNLGPTVTELPLLGQPSRTGQQFRITGDAFVERQIGRTWSVRGSYRRGLSYAEALTGPSYTNNASVETGGFLNRRLDLSLAGGYALGRMAAAQIDAASQFTTYTADARLRIGLSRRWAAFIDTLWYDYDFGQSLILVPGLPRQFNRRGVHVGLMLWQPMWTEHHAAR